MGLDDPEDVIPAVIVIVSILGVIGALTTVIPSIADVPVLSIISSSVHTGFMFLGNFLAPFIGIEVFYVAVLFEVVLTVLCIWIIVHFGF